MSSPLICYPTLAQALECCTSAENPDPIAAKVLSNLTGRFPDATHVVLFVTTDPGSLQFGAWHAIAVGPSNSLRTVREAEGVHLNDTPSLRMYPVAWVELTAVRNRNFLESA